MMTGKTRQRDSRRPRRGRGGFTLIELLVVIGILGLLISLVVGIGWWVTREGKIQQTMVAQKVIQEAINAFYKSSDPPVYPADHGAGATSGEWLQEDLVENPDAVKVLQGLSVTVWRPRDAAFKDGFRNDMRYDADGGMGGVPVVISAGPDGVFDTDDDIRSDMQ